jgi:hypothetical protein
VEHKVKLPTKLTLRDLLLKLAFSYTKGGYIIHNEELFDSLKGVYAVRYKNKQDRWETTYVGSYAELLYRRWLNVGNRRQKLGRHDKFNDFLKDSMDGRVFVYAVSEEQLAKQIQGPIYNQYGVEEWLLRQDNYKFNIRSNLVAKVARGSHGRHLRSK